MAFTFSLEMAVYTVYVIFIAFIALFGERLERLLAVIPFFYIAPSVIHNPSVFDNSIFLKTGCLIYMCVIGFVALVLIGAVTVNAIVQGNRKIPSLSLGYIFLGIAYMFSGVFSSGATLKNFVFGFLQFVFLSAIYFVGIFIIDSKKSDKSMFSKIGCAMGLTLLVEIFDIYMFSGIFDKGFLNRGNIITGWGIHNNLGNMICFCIPCAFYMMYRSKGRKMIWFLYACLLMIAVILTTSRGSILTGVIVFILSSAVIIAKGNKKKLIRRMAFTTGAFFALAIVLFCFMWTEYDFIKLTVEKVLNSGIFNDSNRFKAWREGLGQFMHYPVFGKGFYECSAYLFYDGINGLVPAKWHNTVIQLLASCGIVGMVSYMFHRLQTVMLFWKLKTAEGWLIALSISAILLGSLTDNHLFNLGPGIIYGMFLAFAEAQFIGKTETAKHWVAVDRCK